MLIGCEFGLCYASLDFILCLWARNGNILLSLFTLAQISLVERVSVLFETWYIIRLINVQGVFLEIQNQNTTSTTVTYIANCRNGLSYEYIFLLMNETAMLFQQGNKLLEFDCHLLFVMLALLYLIRILFKDILLM